MSQQISQSFWNHAAFSAEKLGMQEMWLHLLAIFFWKIWMKFG